MCDSSRSSAVDRRKSAVDWPRFVDLIRNRQRILLTSHVRPDCDAVGSELAMAAILERLGKEVRIVNAFDTPPNLRFIDPDGKLECLGTDVPAEWIASIDLLMVLDTTAWAQLGEMGEVIRTTRATKAVLDHQFSPTHNVDSSSVGYYPTGVEQYHTTAAPGREAHIARRNN